MSRHERLLCSVGHCRIDDRFSYSEGHKIKMFRSKLNRLFSIIPLVSAIAGCTSIQMASNEANTLAKTFSSEKGKSILYVVQDGGYTPGMALFQITVNGQPQGSLAGWTFHRMSLNPGKHTIVATTSENEELLEVETTADSIIFVSVPSAIGWAVIRVGDMRILSESEGKAAVLEANLARGIR